MPRFVNRNTLPAILSALLLAGACDNTSAPTFSGPPPLPDLQSMRIVLDFFLEPPVANSEGNFNAAAQTVAAANAATVALIPVPITVYAGVNGVTPVGMGDGYHWTYNFTEGSQTFDANLVGRARGIVDAVWTLSVSSASLNPPLTNFVMATGVSSLLNTSGTWRIFDIGTPTAANPLLDIDWVASTGDDEGSWSVVFTNAKVGSADIGDQVEFQSTLDLRRLFYRDQTTGNIVQVEWNAETRAGYIQSPTFNGGVRACWNATLKNVACTF